MATAMRSMFGAAVALVLATAAMAGPQATHQRAGAIGGDFVAQHMVTLTEQLRLSSAQQSRIEGVLRTYAPRLTQVRGALENCKASYHRLMQAEMQQARAEVQDLLTPEQQQRLASLHEGKQTKAGHGHGAQGHGAAMASAPHAAQLAEALGLTDEQQEQVTGILERRGATIKTLRADLRLAIQRYHLSLSVLSDPMYQQVRASLTPQQARRFDALRAEHSQQKQHQGGRGAMSGGAGHGHGQGKGHPH